MMHTRTRKLLLSAAALAALPTAALAQVSDTWAVDVGTAGGSWSVAANWANGGIPDAGGTATFGTLPTFTTAPLAIFQDLSTVTLSGLSFPTQITYQLRAPTAAPTNSITLSGAARIDTPNPSINTLSTTTFGHLIDLPVAGSAGLLKTGPGTATLWRNNNTYTGTTQVNEGILVLRQIGDAGLGATGNSVSFDGGTIRVTTTAWTSARTIDLAAGGGTIEASTTGTTTWNGTVQGVGGLNKIGSRGLNLTALNPYAGATNVLAGSIGLSGNGAITATSALTVRDSLVLDNTATNVGNRVSNAAPVMLHGAALTYIGNNAASNETFAPTTFSRGTTTVTVTPGAGGPARVEFIGFSRELGGSAFFRGTNLGAPLGPGVAAVSFATPPALVGGGGGPGTTNISIIPWAFGNTNATAALNASTNSFVTLTGVNGVRPLDLATEYVSGVLGAAPTDNVRFTGASALGGAQTINSLILAGSGPLAGAGTLTITSGALLNTTNGYAMDVNLNFGPAEAMILAPASISLNGVISGSGGLSKQGAGVATFGGANTYTGTTVIGGGTTAFLAGVPSGAPSPFGSSTSAIVLAPAGVGTGGTTARLVYAATSGSAAFDRDLTVSGRVAFNNAAILPGFGVVSGSTLTMNGDILLDQSPMTFVGGTNSLLVVNGDITGNGGPITDNSTGAGTIRLAGNNTFTDGAELSGATWQVASDSAFGNGGFLKMVQLSGSPTIQAFGGPRSIANPTVNLGFSATYWTIGGANDLTFTGSINLSGSFNHVINNLGLTTYAGMLHTGGLTKSGPGTLVLSGNNTYTGTTTVSAGVLRAAHDNALGGTAANTVVAGGAQLQIGGGVNSGEPVTINGAGISNDGAVRSTGGNNTLGDLAVASAARVDVDAGQLGVGNVSAAAGVGLFKGGAGVLSARRYRAGALDVLDGTAAVRLGRDADKTSVVNTLVVATGARLDLGDNDLVIDYPTATPYALVKQLLTDGYAAGAWNGTGIASAAAAATPGSRTALGYAEASDVFTTFPATFGGQAVDNTSVLVRYTLSGDATLDGTVGIGDFSILGAGYNQPGDWSDGDFNYDGTVGIGDFSLLAANFNQSLPATAARPGAVPEPAALGIVGLLGLIATRRRRGA